MLLFASLPPRGWWWVGVAGLALLAVALRDLPWRRRVACGYLAGLGLFGPALAWVAGFSLAGAVLLVALEAGFLGVTAGLVLRGRVLLLPPALVLGEWLRRSWPFGGFPLAGPALGQVDAPFASTAALAGPLAVVAVAGIIGVALSELVGGRRGRAVGLVVAGVVAASSGGMAASATAPAGRDLQVDRKSVV